MASSLTLQRRSQRAAEESAAFGPIAERFRRAGDLDRAVNLCREGLTKFPHHISARVTLGWALLDQGKYDEARLELEQVMRRAPDNLAAIRGMAELHDRAEHTMNLSMDGPGQWPPDEQAVEHASVEAEPQIMVPASYEALDTAVQFTADAVDVEIQTDSPAVFTAAPPTAPIQYDAEADLETEADLEALIAQATVAGVAAEQEVHSDPVAYAEAVADALAAEARTELTVDHATDEPAWQAEQAHEADLVSEADIVALIAEAEKLEAAAAANESVEMHAEIEETVDAIGVAGNIELDSTDDVDFGIAEAVAEPFAEPVAEAVAEPVAEPVAEVVAEAVADVTTEPMAEVAAEVVTFEPAAEIAEPEVAAEIVEPEIAAEVAEPEIAAEVVEPEIAAQEVLEPAAAVIEEPVAEMPVRRPLAAFTRVQAFEAPVVDGFTIDEPVVAVAIQQAVGKTHLAEIIPLVRAARAESNGNTLVALERLLAKVQARRSELMAQSVA